MRKYRTKKQQGGNVHIPVNSCANSSSLQNNRAFLSRSPEACVMQASQTSPEIDKDRNMLVSLNTNSRKMREYIKQHDIGSSQSEKPKKKPERVNIDKVFEAFNFNT